MWSRLLLPPRARYAFPKDDLAIASLHLGCVVALRSCCSHFHGSFKRPLIWKAAVRGSNP